MAFYRCGGGGIPSSLKTDMNAVLNKKFGTSSDYPPADWAPTVNLMGPLPEKTIVSSPIADFSDGADDVPTKSLVVTIPPTLSGVSSVTETQTGRNLLDNELTTQTVNGTTFTVNADKSITISGTPSATTRVYISRQSIEIKVGSFFSFGTMPTGTRVFCSRTSSGSTTYPTISPSHTATIGAEYTNFLLEVLTTFDGTDFTIYPQLEYGSTAHAYEPYQTPTQYTASLGRTIYGGEVDIVNGVGRETSIMIDLAADIAASAWNMGATDRFRARLTQYQTASGWSGSWQNTVSNVFVCENPLTPFNNRSNYSFANIPQNYYNFDIKVPSGQFENAAEFAAWLANTDGNGKHAIIVIDRSTPETFTFDGQEINTRLGYNAFWSDSGDTEVTYRADISLALGGQ